MRIRTIKPEFWISESVGRLTRDGRLTFIGLWSVADDHGRFRADHRYLAGQLFPYDSDALQVIAAALLELTREGSVTLYSVGGSAYGVMNGWASHQKIDRPSAPKLPAPPISQPREIKLAEAREASCEDQGRDQGSGKGSGIRDQGEPNGTPKRKKREKAQAELPAEVIPPPAPKPDSRIGRLHKFFLQEREARFVLPAPDGLDLGTEVPPDEAPNWVQSAAALSGWVKRWSDLPEAEQDQMIRAVITAWLQEAYWASPKPRNGKPGGFYPWGAFLDPKQFAKAADKAFTPEAA